MMAASGKPSVLIVDDNELNRKLAQDILEANGHFVRTAINTVDAARLAIRTEPKLIFLMLSPLSVICSAARLLRTCGISSKIIAVSKAALPIPIGDRRTALEAGCDDYVSSLEVARLG